MTLIHRKQFNVARLSAVLCNITRYCTTPSLIQESVSDHSFLISLLIIETSTEYPKLFNYVNRENLLIRATLHDLVESVTGDIPSPAKRAVKDGEKVFTEIEKSVVDQLCDGRPDEFRHLLIDAICFDDFDNIEELLFKTFDYLCVLLKTSNELYLGNRYYKRVVREMVPVMMNIHENIKSNISRDSYKELLNFYDNEVIPLVKELEITVNKPDI